MDLVNYYYDSWMTCKEMWMTLYRKDIVGMEDVNTNNSLERFWRSIKDHVKNISSGVLSIQSAAKKMI